MGRVEPVVGVKNRGGVPGMVILEVTLRSAIPSEAMREAHQQEPYQGVVDTRTKLLDSFIILIFILALLHFLMYIQFL